MSQFDDPEVISLNIARSDLTVGEEKLDTARYLCLGRFVTLILPDYRDAYTGAIYHLMGGFVLASAAATPLPDGRVITTSVFGFAHGNAWYNGGDTSFFMPSVQTDFLSLLGDDPAGALDGYHRSIVNQTNAALATISPYRLAAFDLMESGLH